LGSIYNHAKSTKRHLYKIKQKDGTIDFIAFKNIIKRDEEITVDYNYLNPKDKNPLWFEAERAKQFKGNQQ